MAHIRRYAVPLPWIACLSKAKLPKLDFHTLRVKSRPTVQKALS